MTPLLPFLSLLALSGCIFGTSDTSADDTEADTDTDADTDSGDCDPLDPGPVPGPDCLSGSIACGSSVTGTTVGGSDVLDEAFYEAVFCFVPSDTYAGAERVYTFVLPAATVASIALDSPCADLDLVVVRWEEEKRCPRENSLTGACDADAGPGDGRVDDLWSSNDDDARYLLVVDGKDDVEHNFTLSVTCTSR